MKIFKKFSSKNKQYMTKQNMKKKSISVLCVFLTIFAVAIVFKWHDMHVAVLSKPIQLDVDKGSNLEESNDLKDKNMRKDKTVVEKSHIKDENVEPSKKNNSQAPHKKNDEIKKSDTSRTDVQEKQKGASNTIKAEQKKESNDSAENMDKVQTTQAASQAVQNIYNSVVPPYIMPSSEELGNKKIVYLTFDDGPSENVTPQVLDILEEEGVKATFFVIGSLAEKHEELIKREASEGHIIANHSYSHDYKTLYSNVDNFMAEIEKTDNILKDIIGDSYRAKYMRMPGGGFGEKYEPFKSVLLKKGYNYITWNVVTNDAVEKKPTPEKLFANFKETLNGNRFSVVLMHDGSGQKATPQSLRMIIKYLKHEGYEFRVFDK
ncbi:MAG TPA: polysaccharide deacetylase family protein [Clostridiales bacterium]|nr:polysaccharide deacetylase family protein [Clostridiales bacterium]